MINKFLTDIRIIKNAINAKKLVIFAGAGISIDAGVPSWSKLIEDIKADLDLPETEQDFLKIPQIYFNERQEKEYTEKIRNTLGHKKLKHNQIHEEIFELNPEHILTTNFEDLLEQVINKKSLPFSIVKQDKDLPYSHNTKLLVKIHGDLENINFVLKEDDYLNYSSNHPLIEAFIKSIFATKIVLFIGYSYNDYNLKQIIQNVRNILGSNFQNAYLLSIDDKLHHSQRLYLKNKGINVIDYYDSQYTNSKGGQSNYIIDFLKSENILKEKYFQEFKSLSEKGQLLCNFLRFIRFYDELKIVLNERNVVDQMFDSFERFSELKSLPQNFITKLYPFKTSNKAEYLTEGTTLLLKNKMLVDLFYNQIEIENNKLTYKPSENLTDSERKSKEKKLLEIIKKLNNSLIFHVSKRNPTKDSFGYRGFSKDSKNINILSLEKCQCTKCKFERFELNESLTELNSYSINEISDVKEDFQKAYLNYKFGNYHVSFNMFEEIATKAWQIGKYTTYYIAKNNMKSLKGLINNSQEDIKQEAKDKIIEKIDYIDTDKLISQIPYESNEQYDLLKIIRDDTILKQVQDEIDDLFRKVEEIYVNYTQSDYFFTSGPYYPQLIYIQLYKLINFYTENYIIGDIFSNFKKIVQKGIEALLLSYATPNDYNERLDKFSDDFFSILVNYHDSSSLIKFLDKHKIRKLEFIEDDISKILDYCENFFNSLFTRNRMYFNNSYKNENIFNQLSKDRFEWKMKSTFSNIMILMLSVDIPKGRQENFINSLALFLEHENFITNDGAKFLNRFIERNYNLFSPKDCEHLLKIAHEKIRKHELAGTIDTIAYVAKKNNFVILDKEAYAFKILFDFDYYEPRNTVIVPLWEMANQNIKTKLKNELIKRLKNKFSEDLFKVACVAKMIDYNEFFEEYIKYLNKLNSNNNSESIGYAYKNNKAHFNDFSFYNAIIFLYHMGIKSTDLRLTKLENLTDYMKFYIFRENSDLSKFKLEWLTLLDRKLIHEEISRIKPLKKIIEAQLKENFSEDVAKIFTKYFI